MWEWGFKSSGCQYVRVVKEADSKSVGVTRAGSNPAADVFLIFISLILLSKILFKLIQMIF
jgi:hypothetical protein